MSFFSCELKGKGFLFAFNFFNLGQAEFLVNIDCIIVTVFLMHAIYISSIVHYTLTSEPFFV